MTFDLKVNYKESSWWSVVGLHLVSFLPAGGHPSVPAKVQELAESLQQISGQLNTVLSALGSLARGENSTPYATFSTPQPSLTPTSAPVLPQTRSWVPGSSVPPLTAGLSEPLWSFVPQSSSAASPLFCTPISSSLGASELLINSRWSQIFPGMSVFISTAPAFAFIQSQFVVLSCYVVQDLILLPPVPWGPLQSTHHTLLSGRTACSQCWVINNFYFKCLNKNP